ncbi:MAG: hypothetical protein F7C35_08310 [Desulfurococcales archaeon]|nr:hypothetical protein [Desulfurococcales archaeon]
MSLARWLAHNLREWALWAGDDLVLGFASVFEPDGVLGSVLVYEVDGRSVWELIWERCLAGKREVLTGCGEDPETCDMDEMAEAMGCVAKLLRPLAEELGETWSGFARKAEAAIMKLARQDEDKGEFPRSYLKGGEG